LLALRVGKDIANLRPHLGLHFAAAPPPTILRAGLLPQAQHLLSGILHDLG